MQAGEPCAENPSSIDRGNTVCPMSRRDDPLSPAHLAALGVSTAQPDPRSVRLAQAVAVRGTRRGFQRRLSAESADARSKEAKATSSSVVAPPRLGGRGPSATAGAHASKVGGADDSSGVSGDGGTAPALASLAAPPAEQKEREHITGDVRTAPFTTTAATLPVDTTLPLQPRDNSSPTAVAAANNTPDGSSTAAAPNAAAASTAAAATATTATTASTAAAAMPPSSTPKPTAGTMRVCERVILEIIETERAYVGHLSTLASVFIDPLQQRAGTRGEVLSEAAITNVFGNVKQLHVLNDRFLGELERAMDTGALCSLDTSLERIKRVSDVFLDFSPFFKMYKSFAAHALSGPQIERLRRQVPAFSSFLKKNRDATQGQSLGSLMIMPVQRVPRYKLLLGELLKQCEKALRKKEQRAAANPSKEKGRDSYSSSTASASAGGGGDGKGRGSGASKRTDSGAGGMTRGAGRDGGSSGDNGDDGSNGDSGGKHGHHHHKRRGKHSRKATSPEPAMIPIRKVLIGAALRCLKGAIDSISDTAMAINDGIKRKQNQDLIWRIQDAGEWTLPLIQPHRSFVREGLLQVTGARSGANISMVSGGDHGDAGGSSVALEGGISSINTPPIDPAYCFLCSDLFGFAEPLRAGTAIGGSGGSGKESKVSVVGDVDTNGAPKAARRSGLQLSRCRMMQLRTVIDVQQASDDATVTPEGAPTSSAGAHRFDVVGVELGIASSKGDERLVQRVSISAPSREVKEAWLQDIKRCVALLNDVGHVGSGAIRWKLNPLDDVAVPSIGGLTNDGEGGAVKGETAVGSPAGNVVWQPDSIGLCVLCGASFTLLRRRHHCRKCGRLVCHLCSKDRIQLPGSGKRRQRACIVCVKSLSKGVVHSNKTAVATTATPSAAEQAAGDVDEAVTPGRIDNRGEASPRPGEAMGGEVKVSVVASARDAIGTVSGSVARPSTDHMDSAEPLMHSAEGKAGDGSGDGDGVGASGFSKATADKAVASALDCYMEDDPQRLLLQQLMGGMTDDQQRAQFAEAIATGHTKAERLRVKASAQLVKQQAALHAAQQVAMEEMMEARVRSALDEEKQKFEEERARMRVELEEAKREMREQAARWETGAASNGSSSTKLAAGEGASKGGVSAEEAGEAAETDEDGEGESRSRGDTDTAATDDEDGALSISSADEGTSSEWSDEDEGVSNVAQTKPQSAQLPSQNLGQGSDGDETVAAPRLSIGFDMSRRDAETTGCMSDSSSSEGTFSDISTSSEDEDSGGRDGDLMRVGAATDESVLPLALWGSSGLIFGDESLSESEARGGMHQVTRDQEYDFGADDSSSSCTSSEVSISDDDASFDL